MSENPEQQKLLAAALRRLEVLQRREAFDPTVPTSKPTPKQQQVIDDFGTFSQQWIRAGNQSGKSAVCARIVSWVLTESSPTWKRPEIWGSEPLLILVAGHKSQQIEESLLPKIRSFLTQGTYKEVRVGNIIQKLEIISGPGAGNRIVFQSLQNPSEARKNLMSYVAHVTWTDELPATLELVREILVRTQARNGYSLWSFTPTVVNLDIQRYLESLKEPEGRIYRFHMFDNPLYSDPQRKQELLNRYSHLSPEQQEMVFSGEWLSSEGQVYYFNYSQMVLMPEGYSPLWRHVESVDPALKSALGLTVWAEDPATSIWYCIVADYIRGIYVPTDLVREVRRRTEKYNIVCRISDPHEVWYIQTAGSMGYSYRGVYKKSERKGELIKQYQQSLGSRIRLTPLVPDLITETQECRWSDQAEGKIVNGSKYHLLDSAQYFCDNIPRREVNDLNVQWHEKLYLDNERRKAGLEKRRVQAQRKMIIKQRRAMGSGTRRSAPWPKSS